MDQIMRDSLYRIAMAFRTEDEAIKAFETLKGKLNSRLQWREFTVMDLPPEEFVLVYVHFESESNPGARPRILIAFYDGQYWRTQHGRMKGRVSHWMPLPDPPKEKIE